MEDKVEYLQVKINGAKFNIEPEIVKRGCKGCYFVNKGECGGRLDSGQKLVDICRTGHIFTKA